MIAALRNQGRALWRIAGSLPSRMRDGRTTLGSIPIMWIGLAALLGSLTLGIQRVRNGLAGIGFHDEAVLLVVLVASGVLAVLLRHLTTRGAQDELLRGGSLRAKDADPAVLGVRPAKRAVQLMRDGEEKPPHVARGVDDEILTGLCSSQPFVLVVGSSKGGTHALAHAIRQDQFRNHRLLVLKPPAGDGPEQLAALIARSLRWLLTFRPTIVWVGDIGPRLARGGVTMAHLNRFLTWHPHVKIVGTMGSSAFAALKGDQTAVTANDRAVLDSAHTITMPSRLSVAEVREAARLYPKVPHRALPYLPAFLGVGDEIVDRFNLAEEVNPLGYAFVMAAIVWHATVGSPAPEAYLRAACRFYLDGRRRKPSARALLAARLWAEEPLTAGFGLIDPVPGGGGWEPSPSLVEHAELLGAPIPAGVFEAIHATLKDNPSALIAFGKGAVRHGRRDVAAQAWERAALVGDEGHRRIAFGHLAELLRDGSGERASEPVDELLRQRRGRSLLDGISARGPALLHSGDGSRRLAFDPSRPVETTGWVARLYRLRTPRFLVRTATLGTLDLTGVIGGTLIALTGKALVNGDTLAVAFSDGTTLATYAALFAIPAFTIAGLYAEDERRAQFTRLALALGVLAVFTSIAGMLRGEGPLSWTVAWFAFVCAIPVCVLLRHAYDRSVRWLLRHFKLMSRVLFIGERRAVLDAKPRMARSTGRPTTFVGYLSSNAADRAKARLGSPRELARVLREYGITTVVIVDADLGPDAVMRLADECLLAGVTTDRPRSPAEAAIYGGSVTPGDTLALRRIAPAALTIGAQLRKRCFDVIGALVLLALLGLPILLLAGLVRATSPGPAFIRCHRPGLGGAAFPMLKLRTSTVETPRHRSGLGAGVVPSMRRDDVTPLGAVLRRFGLDELPQLWNVLRGEMSLVGPRPLPMADYRRMSSWHRRRNLVAPGITGAWQISGRSGEIDLDETARVDLYYMTNWSVRLDVLILLHTVLVTLRRPTDMPTPFP